MRKYQPIWEQLKRDKKVSLAVAKPLHPRVKKAVLKEKYMDLGHKVLLAETHKRAEIEIKTEGNKITFLLHFSIGLDDL